MKRSKVRQLVQTIHEAERAVPQMPVTYDTLEIDFEARRVTFRGRTINVDFPAVSFPVLSTDRLVIPKRGDVL